MPCPVCGEVCHCAFHSRSATRLRSRFQPEAGADVARGQSSILVDPEADDGSEEKFAASLDGITVPLTSDRESDSRPVEVMENDPERLIQSGAEDYVAGSVAEPTTGNQPNFHPALLETDLLDRPGASLWKQEVAARLDSYRARRKPRPPKYPSLRLKFESAEPSRSMTQAADLAAADMTPEPDRAVPNPPAFREEEHEASSVVSEPAPAAIPERARIIEFPRPYLPPVPAPDELAEAVAERPRILEVPDIEPPPPALGGISLEVEEEKEPERRPGFEIPLNGASMARRLCAAAIDALLVASAGATFAYIAFRLSPFIPPLPQLAVMAGLVLGMFWSGYQYLLLVYTGSTPGLRAAHLRLSDFDGSPVTRARRRWRVIASILSGLSLGLGFAWCFLDEDALCWHDRITHTYLAPK